METTFPSAVSRGTPKHLPLPRLFCSVEGGGKYCEVQNGGLGQGAFGEVIKARGLRSLKYVAIKVRTCSSKSNVAREIKLMRHVRASGGHINVLKLLDVVQNVRDRDAGEYAVLPKCDLDLEKWRNTVHGVIPAYARTEITRQLYAGLSYLHKVGVIHGDLTLWNILVSGKQGQVKIGDFGVSRRCADWDESHIALRTDVKEMTFDIVIPFWLHRAYNSIKRQRRSHFLDAGNDSQLVGSTEYLLTSHPDRLCTNIYGDVNDDDENWAQKMESTPGLEEMVKEMHAWTLSQPNPLRKSVTVPAKLLKPLRYGCLLGPIRRLHAQDISAMLSLLVSEPDRKRAQDYIYKATYTICQSTAL
eukprot:scpid86156/ scgid31660/ Cyclin-dependent kinase 4; Cell division protein kinase 4